MYKKRLLIFIDYFTPGYKAGGPIRSVQSLCDALQSDIDVFVVTRDRDLGDTKPYSAIQTNKWIKSDNANIYYVNEHLVSQQFISKVFSYVKPDIVHLNSLMSRKFSFAILLSLRKTREHNACKVVLCPRGELSTGALSLKRFQKKLYLTLFKLLGLHKRVDWVASSEGEVQDICSTFRTIDLSVTRINNLPNLSAFKTFQSRECEKQSGYLKLVFFSRISPMKNLEFLIDLLHEQNLNISLSIIGPAEDESYLAACQKKIDELPNNIDVKFVGSVTPERVYQTLKEFDLFVLPTLGENFGQAIWESLASSVPVLISDRTPWKNLSSRGVGFDISLQCPAEFVEKLRGFLEMDEAQHKIIREQCREYAFEFIRESNSLSELKKLYN